MYKNNIYKHGDTIMGRKKSVNIGETINGLEILDSKTVNENGTKRGWSKVCCQICGNKKWMRNHLIKRDRTKSCGCLKDKPYLWKQRGPKIMPWQLEKGEAAFNNLLMQYKRSAKKRNLKFNLTIKQFRNLTKSNCYYCDREPHRIIKGQGKTSGDYIFTGIDRIDNSKGYAVKNVVPCCFDCNNAKKTLSQNDFLELIRKIYNKHHKK
jgi:hypothetical protein